jgi:hypothetical protein
VSFRNVIEISLSSGSRLLLWVSSNAVREGATSQFGLTRVHANDDPLLQDGGTNLFRELIRMRLKSGASSVPALVLHGPVPLGIRELLVLSPTSGRAWARGLGDNDASTIVLQFVGMHRHAINTGRRERKKSNESKWLDHLE